MNRFSKTQSSSYDSLICVPCFQRTYLNESGLFCMSECFCLYLNSAINFKCLKFQKMNQIPSFLQLKFEVIYKLN